MARRRRRMKMARKRRRASDKSSTFRFGLFFLICCCECLRCSLSRFSKELHACVHKNCIWYVEHCIGLHLRYIC